MFKKKFICIIFLKYWEGVYQLNADMLDEVLINIWNNLKICQEKYHFHYIFPDGRAIVLDLMVCRPPFISPTMTAWVSWEKALNTIEVICHFHWDNMNIQLGPNAYLIGTICIYNWDQNICKTKQSITRYSYEKGCSSQDCMVCLSSSNCWPFTLEPNKPPGYLKL